MRTCSRCGAPIERTGDLWCAHCGAMFDPERPPDPLPPEDPASQEDAAVDGTPYDVVEPPSPPPPPRRTTDPAPSIQPTGIACIKCGYDVSGTALGSTCPECGTPVLESIPKPPPTVIGPDGVERSALPKSSAAGLSLALGIASVLCCSPAGIVAILVGFSARNDIAKGRVDPSGGAMAIIGIILGIVGTVILAMQIANNM